MPIATDLSDLRQRFEWAESHPVEARGISQRATEFARWMGSVEGFGHLYEEHLLAPLRDVIDAYKPLPRRYTMKGKNMLDVITERFTVVGKCSGYTNVCNKITYGV